MKKRILLSDGCSCSTSCIYPPDWQSGGKALLKKIWYISYRFSPAKLLKLHHLGKYF
ncbi:MAG: hypothetical protein LBT29_06535 [Flavobacteriaceae bacterium]|jgi:hypothetical protein|nr:hypothetical protein [Flavobacteriaceae bacterium]